MTSKNGGGGGWWKTRNKGKWAKRTQSYSHQSKREEKCREENGKQPPGNHVIRLDSLMQDNNKTKNSMRIFVDNKAEQEKKI